MTLWTNHQARQKDFFVCQVVTLSMFTTDFLFEGSPLKGAMYMIRMIMSSRALVTIEKYIYHDRAANKRRSSDNVR